MSKITIDKVSIKNINDTKFIIPNYQRDFVWSPKKQKSLIESVLNDYPIGAILVYKNEESKIIDGLQRITTIKSFSECPKSIFKKASDILKLDIIKENIEELKNNEMWDISIDYRQLTEELVEIYKEWYNSLDKPEVAQLSSLSFSRNTALQKVVQKYKLTDQDIVTIYSCLKNSIDVSYFEVPVMYYEGEDNKLPVIFENLNKNSTILGKYDIYNSTWFEIRIPFLKNECELIQDINAEKEKRKFSGFDRPIINIFKLLHIKLVEIYETVYLKKAPKNLYNLSFEMYSTLFSGDYNDVKSLVQHLNDLMKTSTEKKVEIANFTREVSNQIALTFENIITLENEDVLKQKNILLYMILTQVKKDNIIDFDRLSLTTRPIAEKEKIMIMKYQDILKKNWFRDENRQLNFFKEKCDEFESIIAEASKEPKNLGSDGIIVQKPIEKISKEELSLLNVNNIADNEEFFHLQDVNNEPNNKRIQMTTLLKEAISKKKKVISFYKINETEYIKIEWKLTNEEKQAFLRGGKYSLKLNLFDFQYSYINKLKCYENQKMKYKANLSYLYLESVKNESRAN